MKGYRSYKLYKLLYTLTGIQINFSNGALLQVPWNILASEKLCTCKFVCV